MPRAILHITTVQVNLFVITKGHRRVPRGYNTH